MRRVHLLAGLVFLSLLPAGLAAQTLREKIAAGAAKTAGVVKNTAKAVDNTVHSTVDLAKGEATPQLTREKLDGMAEVSLTRLFSENPAAAAQFETSAGYAVFDSRKSVLLGVTAGFGRGVAVPKPDGARTYMKMATGGVGFAFGIGGFETQVVILFETPEAFDTFVRYGYDSSGQTGAAMGDDIVQQTVRFTDGRSIFVLGKKGWRVSATAAGTKYWPDPALN